MFVCLTRQSVEATPGVSTLRQKLAGTATEGDGASLDDTGVILGVGEDRGADEGSALLEADGTAEGSSLADVLGTKELDVWLAESNWIEEVTGALPITVTVTVATGTVTVTVAT
tara:strand:+ start:2456 stop:2797 length:342 start_codon:yes stop_codon:yes gene_type:complete